MLEKKGRLPRLQRLNNYVFVAGFKWEFYNNRNIY
jgi:hypothetical protein